MSVIKNYAPMPFVWRRNMSFNLKAHRPLFVHLYLRRSRKSHPMRSKTCRCLSHVACGIESHSNASSFAVASQNCASYIVWPPLLNRPSYSGAIKSAAFNCLCFIFGGSAAAAFSALYCSRVLFAPCLIRHSSAMASPRLNYAFGVR